MHERITFNEMDFQQFPPPPPYTEVNENATRTVLTNDNVETIINAIDMVQYRERVLRLAFALNEINEKG